MGIIAYIMLLDFATLQLLCLRRFDMQNNFLLAPGIIGKAKHSNFNIFVCDACILLLFYRCIIIFS